MRYKVELEAPTQLLAEISIDADSEAQAEEKALKMAEEGKLEWRRSNDVEDAYVANTEEE
jgi:hypothetical protein